MFLLVQAAEFLTICYSSHGKGTLERNDYNVSKSLAVQARAPGVQQSPAALFGSIRNSATSFLSVAGRWPVGRKGRRQEGQVWSRADSQPSSLEQASYRCKLHRSRNEDRCCQVGWGEQQRCAQACLALGRFPTELAPLPQHRLESWRENSKPRGS